MIHHINKLNNKNHMIILIDGQQAHEKMSNITNYYRNANLKNYNEVSPYNGHNGHHKKKSTNNKCWRGCGEKGPSHTVGGSVK